ncbi:RNaseH domain-containing protein [Streptomyces griseoruber]|uniref:RNaseH domain-containing protein n=1 Tax=Streptomyces griseoruber TaxID=1943 RepID=UPI0037969AA7
MGCGWSARTAPPAPGGPPTSPVAVLVTPRAPGGGPARVEGWGPDADDGAGAWAPYPAMLLKLTRVGRGEAPSSRIARCRRRTAVRPARLCRRRAEAPEGSSASPLPSLSASRAPPSRPTGSRRALFCGGRRRPPGTRLRRRPCSAGGRAAVALRGAVRHAVIRGEEPVC